MQSPQSLRAGIDIHVPGVEILGINGLPDDAPEAAGCHGNSKADHHNGEEACGPCERRSAETQDEACTIIGNFGGKEWTRRWTFVGGSKLPVYIQCLRSTVDPRHF